MVTNPESSESWSFVLPDRLKIAIADAITLASRIETCVLETVWLLKEAPLEEKKKLARDWASNHFKTLKKAIALIPGAETDAIWPAVKELAEERNLIAHGVWVVDSTGRPLVVWHRRFLESDQYFSGEYFGYEKFAHFSERGEVLLRTFADFKRLLEKALAEAERKD